MREIQSESKFIIKFLLKILLTPITLLRVLLGNQKPDALMQPFYDLLEFMAEPKFTTSIILINTAIFFASLFTPSHVLETFVSYPSDLLDLRLYTLITAGFLHANWSHLVGNMIAIFIFGRVVERKISSQKTAIVYFSALIISSLFSSLIHIAQGNNIGGIGASGALMGLVSTAILLDPFYLTYELVIPLPVMIIGWLTLYADIIGVLNPVEDGIGHFAHIGGFISIAIISYLLGIEERSKLKKGLIINAISFVIAALAFTYFLY